MLMKTENFLTINFLSLLSSHLQLLHLAQLHVGGGPQVFPLPPGMLMMQNWNVNEEISSEKSFIGIGQGFPWAHSTRGKPRRGMMRRAVFSGKFRDNFEGFNKLTDISQHSHYRLTTKRLGKAISDTEIHQQARQEETRRAIRT